MPAEGLAYQVKSWDPVASFVLLPQGWQCKPVETYAGICQLLLSSCCGP